MASLGATASSPMPKAPKVVSWLGIQNHRPPDDQWPRYAIKVRDRHHRGDRDQPDRVAPVHQDLAGGDIAGNPSGDLVDEIKRDPMADGTRCIICAPHEQDEKTQSKLVRSLINLFWAIPQGNRVKRFVTKG